MPPQVSIPQGILQEFQRSGFLRLKVSVEVQQTVGESIEAAYRFFRSPLPSKMQSTLPADLGYRPFAAEYSKAPDNPDQVETFSASARNFGAVDRLKSHEARTLYSRMLATIGLLEPIAEDVTAQLLRELTNDLTCRIPSGAFKNWSFLQLNYSRPSETEKGMINDVHEDGCLITIAFTTGPGLEVQSPQGEFLPIMTEPDEVLAMPGEILWLLSGGNVQPLYHRVRPNPLCPERIGLLFFGDIDPRSCEPWISNDINRGIDIGELVLKNPSRFGLQEWKLP
jgi:isopenicillin N synthase-like dioxygenase